MNSYSLSLTLDTNQVLSILTLEFFFNHKNGFNEPLKGF